MNEYSFKNERGMEEMNLVTSVRDIAVQDPGRTAYHFMGKDTSYGEFEQTVAKFANALESQGVEKGDHVALLLSNTPHFMISLYAAMRIGATAVPQSDLHT